MDGQTISPQDFSPSHPAELHRQSLAVAFATAIILFSAGTATAQVHRAVIYKHRPAVLPGYVTYDVRIDFTGQYTGSQMIVSPTRGQIYQNTTYGGDTPPPAARIDLDPALEWDTFLANGGPTAEETVGNMQLGGAAINIEVDFKGRGSRRPSMFSDMEIDKYWTPAGGNRILDQTDFLVARVTLSEESDGTFSYFAIANQIRGPAEVVLVDGDSRETLMSASQHGVTLPLVGGTLMIIPEPSTVVLLGLGIVGLFVLTRGCG